MTPPPAAGQPSWTRGARSHAQGRLLRAGAEPVSWLQLIRPVPQGAWSYISGPAPYAALGAEGNRGLPGGLEGREAGQCGAVAESKVPGGLVARE